MNHEDLVKRMIDLLAERYPAGLYEFMIDYLPETYREFLNIEDRINRCLLDKSSVETLKAALRDYWVVHMKAIKEFDKAKAEGLDVSELREKVRDGWV
jgi:hypothetical protein